jgi:hypothetical protein
MKRPYWFALALALACLALPVEARCDVFPVTGEDEPALFVQAPDLFVLAPPGQQSTGDVSGTSGEDTQRGGGKRTAPMPGRDDSGD